MRANLWAKGHFRQCSTPRISSCQRTATNRTQKKRILYLPPTCPYPHPRLPLHSRPLHILRIKSKTPSG